ncbi:hypothetical protein OIU91_36595 [Streptomyces sp. NBC_01456]|uniref:hypothetical protein n=1 Tax=unclassified Streptomyces TaxID=2593676 RepID=UPI002E30AB95|nr:MULTISPECIES: hypothetical protein [unclassified Streptomyces]
MPRSRWTERLRRLGPAVLYFAVVTPAGLCARAVRDPLRRSWDGRRASYLDRPAPTRRRFATFRRAP